MSNPTDPVAEMKAAIEAESKAREFREHGEWPTTIPPAYPANESRWEDRYATAFAAKEVERAVKEEKMATVAKLKSWIGRVGHEDYYKYQAKLLEMEQEAKDAWDSGIRKATTLMCSFCSTGAPSFHGDTRMWIHANGCACKAGPIHEHLAHGKEPKA